MSRAATAEAQQAQAGDASNANLAGSRATNELGPLSSGASQLINSQGYDPTTLAAITNAGMGGVNSAFGSAGGEIKRNAARTKNPAGVAGQLDTLAMDKGIAGGQEAGNVQIQNANFKNSQRSQGLNLLSSLYGANTNAQVGNETAQTGAINAQTQASPGWAQTLAPILSGVGGMIQPVKV